MSSRYSSGLSIAEMLIALTIVALGTLMGTWFILYGPTDGTAEEARVKQFESALSAALRNASAESSGALIDRVYFSPHNIFEQKMNLTFEGEVSDGISVSNIRWYRMVNLKLYVPPEWNKSLNFGHNHYGFFVWVTDSSNQLVGTVAVNAVGDIQYFPKRWCQSSQFVIASDSSDAGPGGPGEAEESMEIPGVGVFPVTSCLSPRVTTLTPSYGEKTMVESVTGPSDPVNPETSDTAPPPSPRVTTLPALP